MNTAPVTIQFRFRSSIPTLVAPTVSHATGLVEDLLPGAVATVHLAISNPNAVMLRVTDVGLAGPGVPSVVSAQVVGNSEINVGSDSVRVDIQFSPDVEPGSTLTLAIELEVEELPQPGPTDPA